jgi:hypothetical protein
MQGKSSSSNNVKPSDGKKKKKKKQLKLKIKNIMNDIDKSIYEINDRNGGSVLHQFKKS